MKRMYFILFVFLLSGYFGFAQVTYYSKAVATNFNDVASWGTATNGTGAAPASISNADNFVVGNGSVLTLSAAASVRALYIGSVTGFVPATATGALTIATGNSLTVSRATGNNATLTIGTSGTLTIIGGTLNINGNFLQSSGTFTQSGGDIIVDGNDGGAVSTSVATTIYLFGITGGTTTLSGGKISVLDPHVGTGADDYSFGYNTSTSFSASATHTLSIGNGASTQITSNTGGFILEPFISSGRLILGNLKIDCDTKFVTIRYTLQTIQMLGNLEIVSGDFRGPTGGTIGVAGNLINNGTLTTVGTFSFQSGSGTATSVASNIAQSVTGSGVFRNATSSPTANFASLRFNNSITGSTGIDFTNANSMLSGSNIGTVSGALTFTAGRVNTNGFSFVLGIGTGTIGSIAHTSGGFVSGSKFGRWYAAATPGTIIAASTVPAITGNFGSYPFINGFNLRSFFINRPTVVGATGGVLNVQYTEGAGGLTTIAAVADGAYNIDRQSTANWAITATNGFAAGTGTFNYATSGTNIYTAINTNGRLMLASSVTGTHQVGTTIPHVQRTGITAANFANTFYFGIAAADLPVVSAATGDWAAGATWVGGVSPACGQTAVILNTHNVTVSTAGNQLTNLITNATGTLTMATGGDLTVGCTGNNSSFTNNGTLQVNDGTLTVNGNIFSPAASTFNQTGGNIIVDGNDNTLTPTSVATGTRILNIETGTVTLSGGVLTIVDPHIGSAATDDVFRYSNTLNIAASTMHTIKFGNGVSTQAGGNATSGFSTHQFVSTGLLSFGNVIIDALTGTNRFVTTRSTATSGFAILGNLTITSGEMRVLGTAKLTVAGNLTNDGTLTTIGTLNLNSLSTTTPVVNPNAQTISGAGVFQNLTASATANFGDLLINNSNATGVTFSGTTWNSLASTVSGTYTQTAGRVNIGAAKTFTLGTSAAAAGTLAYTAGGFTEGTFKRWLGTTAITLPSNAGTFPFVSTATPANANRNYLLGTTTLTTGNTYSVTYADNGAGTTPVASFTDNGTDVTKVSVPTWAVSQAGLLPTTATLSQRIRGDGITSLATLTGIRITAATAPIFTAATSGVGTGSTTNPEANKTTTTVADILSTPTTLYFGAGDLFQTAATGNWEDGTTWVGGTSPMATCADVIINAAHIVTINAAAASCKNLQINATGGVTVSGSTLTVGCVNNNNTLTNSGILTVSGGTLNVNGNLVSASGSSFTQSGGVINVDGNSGSAATSVADGTNIVRFNTSTLSLTAGTFTIVDPHASATANIAFGYNSTTAYSATGTHIFAFGDGTSTNAGGNAVGFQINPLIPGTGSSRFSFRNLTINGAAGTNRFVTTLFQFGVINDVVINNNGEFRTGTSLLHVGGNITVNAGGILTNDGTGTIALQFLSASATPSTNAQTIGGAGIFRNNIVTASATGNFSNIVFNNSSSAGITLQDINDIPSAPTTAINVLTSITFTTGKVTTPTGVALLLGLPGTGTAGTLTVTSGGMTAGSTYGRYWTTGTTGSTISAGADPTTTTSRFPFIDATGANRSMWIQRTTPTAAGVLAVTYNDASTISTVSILDGAYTVDKRFDGNWTVSKFGTAEASASYISHVVAPSVYLPSVAANNRLVFASSALGTHVSGTATPGAQRTGLTALQLMGNPVYMGINVADLSATSATSGDWNVASTWVKGVVPVCTDNVTILNTHNVTVNTAMNVSQNTTINTGATLTVASGDVTVGCTLNNKSLTNNGTINVTGGTLNVNGNIANSATSIFNQSGGNINIDGNAAGVVANSVASGISLLQFNQPNSGINLTGGTLTIVDPHASVTASNAIDVNNGTTGIQTSTANHTTQFGDGVSTDAGGNAGGFIINPWRGSAYFSFGNIVVNGPTGTNRAVTSTYRLSAIGDVTVNNEGNLSLVENTTEGTLYFAKDITVNGTGILTTIGNINTARIVSNTSSVPTVGAITAPQSINGNGVYRNLAASSTANLTALVVNNTSASGLTINTPLSISGSLNMTSGFINTTTTNLITLNAGSTLTATPSATTFVNGPIKKIGNTAFTFPTGKKGTPNRVGRCAISATGVVTDAYTAEYFATPHSTVDLMAMPNVVPASALTTPLTSSSTNEYWDIVRVGSSTPDVTLFFADGTFSGITPDNFNLTDLTMTHYNSGTSKWESQISSSLTGTASAGSITATAVSSFSPFAFGSITSITLPIAVNSFTASKQNSNTNAINWKATCTGASVSFELQRSTNGIVFVPINSLTATQARCAAPFNYVDNYNATSPITYYKLKVISNTGEVKYSQIVAINNKNANANIMALYPNIVKGNAVLVVESKTTTNSNFVITDAKGAVVRRFTENLSEGANAYPINVSNLSVGSYQITGIIDGALKTIRFIKE